MYNIIGYVVTGESKSRLNELKKYTVTNNFADMYFGDGSNNQNGVDYISSNINSQIVYFINQIRYVDVLDNQNYSKTTFSFATTGSENNSNFLNGHLLKDPNKEKIVQYPKISDDVFIIRQELSAFDKNFKLQFITNLIELESYAAGRFFNIVNNN